MLPLDPLRPLASKLNRIYLLTLEDTLENQARLDIHEINTEIRLLIINAIEDSLDSGYKYACSNKQNT